jgi:hypothetical protein
MEDIRSCQNAGGWHDGIGDADHQKRCALWSVTIRFTIVARFEENALKAVELEG